MLTATAAAVGPGAVALPYDVQRVDVFSSFDTRDDRPDDGPGTNVLLMGTDGRDTITREEKQKFYAGGIACDCSDTLMLIHVSESQDHVSVVSLPRDSYADIPAHRDKHTGEPRAAHPAKINAAYAEGGPALAVRTVEEMTGVRIDRYLQIDFRRFMDSVDAVDGVDVCTPRQLNDPATKLDLSPGTHRLGGGPALQYVRSRKVDTAADLGRVQRQQQFLVGVLDRLSGSQIMADPFTADELARTVLGSTQVDQGFTVSELVSLTWSLSQLPASRTEFATVPIGGFNPPLEGVGSTLRWDQDRARDLFGKLNADLPLTPRNSTARPLDPPLIDVQYPVRGDTFTCS
ncbi:LCP family protein [Streptomyces apocyni]|uniref:LCP family protein n=1 Tax=Streptomyces apocyni TaxID=2654677 RepID=UPI001E53FB16|nr:LCP family protein [Streptomyces apocyni]